MEPSERYIRKMRLFWLFGNLVVSLAGCAGIFAWYDEITQSRSAIRGWVLVTGVSTLLWPIFLRHLVLN